MSSETDPTGPLAWIKPELNEGEFVFCTIPYNSGIDLKPAVCTFREKEGLTVILPKETADKLHLSYSYIASWITLTIHSSLETTGLTAAFSKALSDERVSCNVVAAFYHDHIFVASRDVQKSMRILSNLQVNLL